MFKASHTCAWRKQPIKLSVSKLSVKVQSEKKIEMCQKCDFCIKLAIGVFFKTEVNKHRNLSTHLSRADEGTCTYLASAMNKHYLQVTRLPHM